MSTYPTGLAVVADARLRLDKMSRDRGVLIVEGSDDRKLFGRAITREQIIPAGGRTRLLEAHTIAGDSEAERILFVTDCDYDVPAGALTGEPNLVLTENPDVEADLVGLGVVREVVAQLVPQASEGDKILNQLTDNIEREAIRLAEAAGMLRHVSRLRGIALRFEGLELRQFRDPATKEVREADLLRVVRQRSGAFQVTEEELMKYCEEAPSGLKVCNGHDLVEAIGVVLRQDHNVQSRIAGQLLDMTHLACTDEMLANWSVLRRIRRWEQQTGRILLR